MVTAHVSAVALRARLDSAFMSKPGTSCPATQMHPCQDFSEPCIFISCLSHHGVDPLFLRS